ncbi:MAG TPA: type I methionyl aminopeptidase [Saprospiraceae bacterium]|nr:type I methionyl aminopeptidase [Saprospiraceae bacterium]HRO08300.1 type I methionyl aminopeptidase [Saprospiraceae bacterium]HRO72693.1 type I methionyl aminopeptidase [Saprospiraceae bacterium]HRP41751.1 type I methionyl aminopeptidase [Saprospiraceae bacterium]
MIYYKTAEEIELIRESSLLVSKTLAFIAANLKVGIAANRIDIEAETFIRDNGGVPAFKGYRGFPATLCMSFNDAVVHGIPSDKEFLETDIISVDCGVVLNGFYGDSAYTFAFNNTSEEVHNLLRITRSSLNIGIEEAVVGNRIGDISFAIQNYCERKHGYGVVRELVGHGVGRSLHEEPEVPNFGQKGRGPLLKEGLVIAIEPMINLGSRNVKQMDDGWTILTRDGKPSAHYEHTIAVRKNGPDILSDHSIIDIEVKNNPEIMDLSINC